MSENGLQRCLLEKYGIEERLLVEGTFVQLADHTQEAAGLVQVGLGVRCVVQASVSLSGDELDFDLMSITPLPLVHMTYNGRWYKLRVSSRYKPPQSYQLCSSEKQAEVWDTFTTAIDYVNGARGEEVWCKASFDSSSSSSVAASTLQFETQPVIIDSMSNSVRDIVACKYENGQRKHIETRFTSVSLPTLTGPSDGAYTLWQHHMSRGHSENCIDVQFDAFVNQEAPSLGPPIRCRTRTQPACHRNSDQVEDSTKKPQSWFARFKDSFFCNKKQR